MLVFGLFLVCLIVAGGVFLYLYGPNTGLGQTSEQSGILTYTASLNDILVTVTEDGNVESASNVDVKCEVAGGATILSIVEDGKIVEEGEELVTLDTANIEDQLNSQNIVFEKALATKIQSQEDHEAAEIGVKEYEEGTFVEELKNAEAEIRIAEENLRTAKNVFQYTKKMVRKGFATSLQREADQFAVERAKLDVEAAKTRKKVLVEFTKLKTQKELVAKREAAAAKTRADQAAFKLEESKLNRLKKQLDNCIILAPRAGMVVYANDAGRSRFGSQQQVQIEEGAAVRERQVLIRLPDRTNMQVKVTVHESKVDQLTEGMNARIVIQEKEYKGHIVAVANQPESTSWFSANVKEYATTVAIEGESTGLRPGQTAHVEILIDELKSVLTIPVSSVVENRGRYSCWVQTKDGHEQRILKLGQTNDKLVQVIDGVKEGDVVLRNPRAVVAEARKEVPMEEEARDRSQFGGNDTSSESSEKSKSSGKKSQSKSTGDKKSGGPESKKSGGGRPQSGGGSSSLPESGKAYIEKYDKDGDGKVAQDELDENSQRSAQFWFGRVDTDGDGNLNESETDAWLKARRERQRGGGSRGGGTSRGGRSLMDSDKDGDKKISKDEAPEWMKQRFDSMDADGDGFITEDELQQLRSRSGGGGNRPGGGGPPGGPRP